MPSDLAEPGSARPPVPFPVLATKLHAPAPRAQRVHRERLLARLDAGGGAGGGSLSLLSAPAGFGKSTLIGDWLRRREEPSAWLSLDPADSDLRRFLSYLVASLERPLPGVGRGLAPALAAPHMADPEPALTMLLNELWSGPGCVLVLDDYHVIESVEVHAALTFLLDHLPPAVRLVMATRVDPPLPLPRLRVRGLLCELRAEDLRFTGTEAALFLRDTMGLDVAAEEVEALERRTEGWIAGLQMAALSLRGRDDVSAFIAGFTGSHRFVLDYLSEEVLDRLPPERIEFLLRTSILSRFCGPLCDAVNGRQEGGGQEILEGLETANLFLIPLDETRGWYRYHHLFAGLLQDELRRRTDEAGRAVLHARAAGWLAAQGLPDEALPHACAAADWERALDILEEHATAFLHRAEVGTVGRWFAMVPRGRLRGRPRLLFSFGVMLFSSFRWPDLDALLAEMETARAAAEAGDARILAAGLDTLRTMRLAGAGDYRAAAASAAGALDRLPAGAPGRGVVQLIYAIALFDQDASGRALAVLEEAAAANSAEGNVVAAVLSRSTQGWIEAQHGRLRASQERHEQALALAAALGTTKIPVAAPAWAGLADVALERGELDRALELAATAADLARFGEMTAQLRSLSTLLRVQMSRGDLAAARAALARIEALTDLTGVEGSRFFASALRARLDVVQGWREGRPELLAAVERWAEAQGLLAGWDRLGEHLAPAGLRDFAHLTIARLLLATERAGAALGLLAGLRTVAEEKDWRRSRIEACILTAVAHGERGEAREAAAALAQARELAEPEGYVQLFADEGMAAADRATPPVPPILKNPRPAEALSEREIEVLRAVASGLSNAEAARRLHLSPFTVKKHLENIYGKLGVRNRVEAVAQARGLLSLP